MLAGWYCRTLANEQAAQNDDVNVDVNDDDSGSEEEDAAPNNGHQNDHKAQYRYLKRKLKFLIFENEFFQDALRSNQRRLLKVSRDRTFLLDRLLQYEKPETSSDSEETESSEDEAAKEAKKSKVDADSESRDNGSTSGTSRGRKKKTPQMPTVPASVASDLNLTGISVSGEQSAPRPECETEPEEQQQGHMTPAEVERHLQSRQTVMELMPERAPATVPTEMFSNEPSLDSESNDHILEGGSSPTHVAAEECVPMEYSN